MTLENETIMNPIRDQNYFSLDLELNNLNNGETPKIIQVGVCVGSPIRPEELKTYSWYINPEEPITPFITQLTGITDKIIQEKAVPHQVIAKELGDILTQNQCFCNGVVWGGGGWGNDATELKDEFTQRGIEFPFFGRRIVDVKTIYVFNQIVKGRTTSGGLRKSMVSYGLDFTGTAHRADDDAKNTLRFFFHLIKRQETFEITMEQMKQMR